MNQVQQEGLGTQTLPPNPNQIPLQNTTYQMPNPMDQRPYHPPPPIPQVQVPHNQRPNLLPQRYQIRNPPIHIEDYGRGEQEGYDVPNDDNWFEEEMRERHDQRGHYGRFRGHEARQGHIEHPRIRDIGINSIKVGIPIFKSESDSEMYLSWECYREKIFQVNDLFEEKKSFYTISHFK